MWTAKENAVFVFTSGVGGESAGSGNRVTESSIPYY